MGAPPMQQSAPSLAHVGAPGERCRAAVASFQEPSQSARQLCLVPRLAFPNYKQRLLIRGAMPVSGGTRNQGWPTRLGRH